MNDEVVVIDYGMGNLWSVCNALNYVGAKVSTTSDPDLVGKASKLILPGVGSFRLAMEALRSSGLEQAILEAVVSKGGFILGICLGMQLMGSMGYEDGETSGLSLMNSKVERFTALDLEGRKAPHIGFNEVKYAEGSRLFNGLSEKGDFYFVHSYRMLNGGGSGLSSYCNYGVDFLAAYERENIFATQFHPEKSQGNGLKVLSNFVNLNA